MSAMLSRYLKDFGDVKPIAAVPAMQMPADDVFSDFPEIADEPPVDVETERRNAYAEGHAAAAAELGEKHAIETQTLELVHQRELEEMKTRYDEQMAEVIAVRLADIAAGIADLVSAATANVIAPIISDAVAGKATLNLAEVLRDTILDGEAGSIAVKGPAHLFEQLKMALGGKGELLRHVENDDVDLIVELDDTVLVTRISAWSAGLKKVLE
jgi:hypothetical protein